MGTWPAIICPDLLPRDPEGVTVVDFESARLNEVLLYDRSVLRCDRTNLVTHLVKAKPGVSVVALNKAKKVRKREWNSSM